MKRSEKFDKAIPYVLVSEGSEFTDDPVDRGGATKYGLSLRGLKALPGYEDWTKDDLKKLSEEEAKDIYYKFFWEFENINSQKIATKLFDIYVNLPPIKAVKIFQVGANACGGRIVVDGVWGPRTVSAINLCDEGCYLDKIVVLLAQYYSSIVKVNPSQGKFLKGWLRRANKLP